MLNICLHNVKIIHENKTSEGGNITIMKKNTLLNQLRNTGPIFTFLLIAFLCFTGEIDAQENQNTNPKIATPASISSACRIVCAEPFEIGTSNSKVPFSFTISNAHLFDDESGFEVYITDSQGDVISDFEGIYDCWWDNEFDEFQAFGNLRITDLDSLEDDSYVRIHITYNGNEIEYENEPCDVWVTSEPYISSWYWTEDCEQYLLSGINLINNAPFTLKISQNGQTSTVSEITPIFDDYTYEEKIDVDISSYINYGDGEYQTRLYDCSGNIVDSYSWVDGVPSNEDYENDEEDNTSNEIVNIPDTVLEDEIRSHLNKYEGDITRNDMLGLTEFTFEYNPFVFLIGSAPRAIHDIEGLQYAQNLQKLNLIGNPIEDISQLENLMNLKELYLSDCPIEDYTPLTSIYSNLTNKDFRLEKIDKLMNHNQAVASDKIWTVQFNMPLDESTINNTTVMISDSNYDAVDGTRIELSADKMSILIYPPAEGYSQAGTYKLFISHALKSESGNPIKQNIEYSFDIE